MGHFSVEITGLPGSLLSGNQHAPVRNDATNLDKPDLDTLIAQQKAGLPADGTQCKFTYGGKDYVGSVEAGVLKVEGIENPFKSFSAASGGVTNTSRNGWMDWYLLDANGQWLLADDWRKQSMTDSEFTTVEAAN